MSIVQIIEIECPRCGSKSNTSIWSSINTQLSPEAKGKLLEGKINLFNCLVCSLEAPVSATLLYHDMERKFCARFVPFSMVEKNSFLDEFNDNAEGRLPGIPDDEIPEYFKHEHIVFSMEELIRYVVFRDRLDERKLNIK